ncbi:3-deoxy-8-phosphooctulonate synthase [Salidesulfovibrio onnuriiensis]|uniref:3-deoxy-8-phosphooctulonate synthase n=1 Tax=Salidesulfovibrio onnuriiensis TaxID=2583823 RepID=UPI0011CBE431|nr:3-deoxy-8-phosphooctulonate synthase [Salidesulfovibrio onnuriiensis]
MNSTDLYSVSTQGPFIIAGPCVIEQRELTLGIARELKAISERLGLPIVFKSSFDKANRTSGASFRGPGMQEGLEILSEVRKETGLPVVTDIHWPEQAATVAEVADVLQIPAFLCRQTDLLLAAAKTGKIINIKKGQFLAPWDMENAVNKIREAGNDKVWLTERGATFGYNNLVVDFRSMPIMGGFGVPTVFDATHSVQLPGGQGGCSGGQREFVPVLARAAVGAGARGVFLEVHPDPDKALCDGPNSLYLDSVEPLLRQLKAIWEIVDA